MPGVPSLILSNPLDGDDAQAIGLNIRAYAVGEIITVNDFAAVTLIRTGYAVAYGTGQDVLLTGGGPPTDATGTDGQWYLDTQAEVLWGPKTGGYWPSNPIRPDRGVAHFAVDDRGHLMMTYSTGTTVDLGSIAGPATSLAIGAVTTGAPGSPAAAAVSGTAPNQTLALTIPQGAQGAQGAKGDQGIQGIQGVPGPGAPDATPTVKGLVQLAGDLGGTAAAPTVPGKVPTGRLVTAGTGLTGGGDLSADRTLAVTYGAIAGTAAQGNDSRITGAQQASAKGAASGYPALDDSSGLLVPGYAELTSITAPAAPATGKTRLYVDTGGLLQLLPATGSGRRVITDWGAGTTLPAVGAGMVAGDTYQHNALGRFVYGSGGWRQITVPAVADAATRVGYVTTYASALYAGLRVRQTDTGDTWEWNGAGWGAVASVPPSGEWYSSMSSSNAAVAGVGALTERRRSGNWAAQAAGDLSAGKLTMPAGEWMIGWLFNLTGASITGRNFLQILGEDTAAGSASPTTHRQPGASGMSTDGEDTGGATFLFSLAASTTLTFQFRFVTAASFTMASVLRVARLGSI